jgi:hypothetical protein
MQTNHEEYHQEMQPAIAVSSYVDLAVKKEVFLSIGIDSNSKPSGVGRIGSVFFSTVAP